MKNKQTNKKTSPKVDQGLVDPDLLAHEYT